MSFLKMFEIYFASKVKKDLTGVPKTMVSKIKKDIQNLSNFPDLSNIKKLNNHPLADFSLRTGNYRTLFDVDTDNKIIYILKIGHRKDIY
ncbi:MAG: type II toxin-antitoxin system RelE/ParE family toxin [Flexistipes sinusarabici]|uniref:Type II toxin-antitoxin system RelE/ParE family toxin n=2 Tax=Flexistipes sinusarabici TaxID=2352 RepID=A0A5D0MR91_FLESI|nr:MAG: type II toxin-antitoxin system RelE/ParE family toxin [Flexistipes sinusarabici]